jgi:hypothetical protein
VWLQLRIRGNFTNVSDFTHDHVGQGCKTSGVISCWSASCDERVEPAEVITAMIYFLRCLLDVEVCCQTDTTVDYDVAHEVGAGRRRVPPERWGRWNCDSLAS